MAGQDEDAGTDADPNAKDDQVQCAEVLFELVFGFFGVLQGLFNTFCAEDSQ